MDLGTIDLTQVTAFLQATLGYVAPVLAIVAGAWLGPRIFGYIRRQFR